MSSEWKTTTLGQICSIQGGAIQTGPFGSQLHTSDYKDVGIPVVMPTNIGDGGIVVDGIARIDQLDVNRLSQHKLQLNDIVFSRRGDVTKNALVRPHEVGWFCGTGCLKVRLGTESIANARFISHCLRLPDIKEWLIRHAVGATMPNLNTAILAAVPITLPPLQTQIEIAEILGALDDRITLLRETNATLEAIAQALFKSWFVDFDPVRAKMEGRAPEGMDEATAALFPDSFKESELGLVPRGWSYLRLADCCSYLTRGVSPKYVEEGGLLVLNQKCIRGFSIDYSKGRRHDPSQRKVDGRELAIGDVLVNSTGVGTLGRVAQVLELPEPAIVDSHVTVVRAGEMLSWSFLGQWMIGKQPEIEAMGEGSTGQTELSRAKLGAMAILVPSREALCAFDSVVATLKARVSVNESTAKTLASTRDALLPRLISGQLSTAHS
ncbi:MAG: restriction endonuclease subunit S [Hydrogenophaga sp.]|uniref:restriction endonuclease subunit S n=1 Tax=Hydrogenophaga sp. TaxID=1904254 RepID=UPI002ABB9670|nr:restriction endonuclease subunit S [Hydrogenophaga sp.]MDZ4187245.1 restriction endonuclease subunit S [Hydrogenophaga sp.]